MGSDTYTESRAVISGCGAYRYRLDRAWGEGAPMVVIGVNPSTADAQADDPTIRRCVNFARAHDCGALVMVNVFARRATDVHALRLLSGIEARGTANTDALRGACHAPGALVVCAWGDLAKLPTGLRLHPHVLTRWLREDGVQLHVLRLTRDGHPAHPLYLPASCRATPWGGYE